VIVCVEYPFYALISSDFPFFLKYCIWFIVQW